MNTDRGDRLHDEDEPLEDDEPVEGDDVPGGLSVDDLSDSFAQLLGHDAPPRTSAATQEMPATSDDVEASLAEAVAGDETSSEPVCQPAAEQSEQVAVTPESVVEAIVFVGHPNNEPLTNQEIASLIRGVEPADVDELVRALNAGYARSGCPYEIASVGVGYRLQLRGEFNPLRDKFYGRVREARLTQLAIDVLSVVSYQQPITRKDVEAICQRPAGSVLNQLVRRQLLAVERREDHPREPFYRTTDRFLELFGLASLDELPRSQDSFDG